jgi:hypothetical protein
MLLHVANGHCTTRLIESSGVPGRTQVWADPLNEGPVPGDIPDDELLLVRARSSPIRGSSIARERCRARHPR